MTTLIVADRKRWVGSRHLAWDQRSSLSAVWTLPTRVLKGRNASHELAYVTTMTLAIASGGRSEAFGHISASTVVTMATASSTGWESEAERSPAKSWIRWWRWLGRHLGREALHLIGKRNDLRCMAIDVFTMASPVQGVMRGLQELDVVGNDVHVVLQVSTVLSFLIRHASWACSCTTGWIDVLLHVLRDADVLLL